MPVNTINSMYSRAKCNLNARPWKPNFLARGILLLGAAFAPFHSIVAQPQFTPLPYLSRPAEPNAITRDGTTAVGYSYSGTAQAGNAACSWTSAGVAAIPGQQDWYDTSAYGISADSTVIVGEGNSTLGLQYAWYWTSTAGALQKVPVPQGAYNSTASGVTADGKVVVGMASYLLPDNSFQYKGFRWDRSQSSAVSLALYPAPPNAIPSSSVAAISDDGRRIVGKVLVALGAYAAARWDEAGTPLLFSRPGDATQAVAANAISPNGSIVVGSGVDTSTGKGVAFKWTTANGVVALPNPTTGRYAIDGATALGISGDGRVIVGYGMNVAGDQEAIFWVDGQPYRVSDVLLPPLWEPFRATAADYFGNTIVGWGRGPSGGFEPYVLTIGATPTPPPLVAPTGRYSFTSQGLSMRYQTVPGLRYRVHGGSNLAALAPLTVWTDGIGAEQEFVVTPAVSGGSSSFFLKLEVAR
jgi:uncharacterized membrane protein